MRRTANKSNRRHGWVTDGALEETTSKRLCRAAGMGRTAKNGTFAVRLTLSRTAIKTKGNKKYNTP
jgi:hypothetical protein